MQDERVEVPTDPLVEDLTELLALFARAGEYALLSAQWNQLENILRCTWNCITYHIITPLEFERTGAYKEITLFVEQVLSLLQHFNDREYEVYLSKFLKEFKILSESVRFFR